MNVSRTNSNTRFFVASLTASTLLVLHHPAWAQSANEALPSAGTVDKPSGPTTQATPPTDTDREVAKKKAETAFYAALAFWKKGQWGAALLQYEAAQRMFPTWSARTGVAACLVKLQRYDEALDVFESALHEFGDKLPQKTKASALEQVDIMRTTTAAVVVTGAPPGALVFVDGRLRGEHPLTAPATTLVGRHLVRVYKEGFVVYEKDIEVAQGGMETLGVTLTPLSNAGRLSVGEVGRKKMEVVVDGVPVGVTPWEGPVSPGPHSVALRPITILGDPRSSTCDDAPNPDASANSADTAEQGTEPISVVVKEGATTTLSLRAEPLSAALRIVPNPPDADVYIDGVRVGRGTYVGRAKPGKHVVKTVADGYFPIAQEVNAAAGDETSPPVRLRKDLNAPKWIVHGQFVVEARGSVPLSPSFGGDLAQSCQGLCLQSLGVGARADLRGGYETANGLALGLTAGYLRMTQTRLNRPATILIDTATGPQTRAGTANDSTTIESFVAGAYGSYRIGQRFPLRFGLGAGVLLGNVSYTRTGIFENQVTGPLTQIGFFPLLYVEPEMQIGVRITEGLSAGVSFSGMVLIAPRVPVWTQVMRVNAHGENVDQLGSFTAETITGGVFFTMTQGLYVRYGF